MPPLSPSSSQFITINLSSHPPKTPLGIILAPSKIDPAQLKALDHGDKSNTNSKISSNANINYNNSNGNFNPQDSTTIVLVGYTRHNHKMGPVQKSNLVRIGDVLVEINGVSVRKMSFRRVLDLMKCMVYGSESSGAGYGGSHLNSNAAVALTSIGFEDGRKHSYIQGGGGSAGAGRELEAGIRGNVDGMAAMQQNHTLQWNVTKENTLYMFKSWIQRARSRKEEEHLEDSENQSENQLQVHFEQDDDITFDGEDDNNNSNFNHSNNHNNSKKNKKPKVFVQYEIKCLLKIKQNNQHEEETSWSMWKRYSEIKKLDDHIRKTFHWSMEGIKFPSSNVFYSTLHGATHSKFVQRRKVELEMYWNNLQNVDGLFDFGDPNSSHRYSYMMADFLDVKREYFQPRMNGGGGGITGGGSVSVGSRPNFIQVEGEGHNLDESTVSILSNSVEGGGVLGTATAQTGSGHGLAVPSSAARNKSSDMSIASESIMSINGGKKKKKRKKVAAKAAFQRRLMDDL